MTKSIIKNIIIGVLVATCAALTVRLWFGSSPLQRLFPAATVTLAVNPANQPMSRAKIQSARLETFGISFYGNISESQAWNLADSAFRALISDGVHSHSGTACSVEIEAESITIAYNFTMSASFFREYFGNRPGFLSSVFMGFESVTMLAQGNEVLFYFFENATDNFHAFSLQDPWLAQSLKEFFALPQAFSTPLADIEIGHTNPVLDLRLSTVRDFVSFFFPNPSAIVESTINHVHTYRDSRRVVRFYPNNVAEYSAMAGRDAMAADFTAAFLAALEMIDRDRTAMANLGVAINDIVFVKYRHDNSTGRFVFYFDYAADGKLLDLSKVFSPGRHAVEVEVAGNSVVRYRRIMLNFYIQNGFGEEENL